MPGRGGIPTGRVSETERTVVSADWALNHR
jgi:hypothetical protein